MRAGELSTAAGRIAKELGGETLALELNALSPELRCEGKVLLLKSESPLESDPDLAAEAVVVAAKKTAARIVLLGDTRFDTMVGAKVAARMGMSALGKGKSLRIYGGMLAAERDVYGGSFVAEVAASLPCVAVVQQGAYQPVDALPRIVQTEMVSVSKPRITELEVRKEERKSASIKSASVVVSVGRGFARKEDLSLARELADALGGALGCSRPIASELGWLGEDSQIGLSGAYIRPRLYLAVGISGQLQHVAGIRDAKVIVAINNDPNAPIFKVADYGIVGDLYKALPVLTEAVRQNSHKL